LVRNSLEVLESIVESSVAGIITIDSLGIVQTFSPAAERLFGYEYSEVVGHNVSMLMPEPDHSGHDGYLTGYLTSGVAHVIGVGREVTGRRKDGSLFPMHLSVGEFAIDGQPMFTGMIHDLSVEVANHKALQESEERFRQLVSNIDEVFMLRTLTPVRYVYVSPGVQKIFGLTVDQAMADPEVFFELIHPDDVAMVRETRATADGVSRLEMEYRIVRPDGEIRSLWARYSQAVTMPGGPALLAIVVSDITTQKAAQRAEASARAEAERANAAKTEFLSRMSHELRTPMNAILGFSQLLDMDELSDNQHASVRQIIRGGRHLLDLINEVLDISRIDSGQLALSPEPVLVSDVMGEVMDLVVPLVTARNLTVLAPMGDVCHEHVLADRQRFKEVLVNLVSNAIKYNRNDGEIRLTCATRPNGEFAITISDTGIGIGAEELGRLFTPFDRLGQESTGEEGTGVGLALSQRLVYLMGGSIEVESTAGVGSSFTVLLPLADVAELLPAQQGSMATAAAIETAAVPGRTSELTIVYVEDNLANVRLMEQLALRCQGVTLIHATQGRLGLELVSSSRPGLILLDLHLPDMSGEEVLRRLQAEATTKDIPTVVVSADASPGQIQRILEMGAAGYLTKPFDVEELLLWFDDPHRMEGGAL
jgi:PAS domain S-box-containing protein